MFLDSLKKDSEPTFLKSNLPYRDPLTKAAWSALHDQFSVFTLNLAPQWAECSGGTVTETQ